MYPLLHPCTFVLFKERFFALKAINSPSKFLKTLSAVQKAMYIQLENYTDIE